MIDDPAASGRLLRAHVAQRADQVAGARQPRVALQLGQAEIGDVNPPFAVEQQIRGLDVAMNHAHAVGIIERFGRLHAHAGNRAEVGRSSESIAAWPPVGMAVSDRRHRCSAAGLAIASAVRGGTKHLPGRWPRGPLRPAARAIIRNRGTIGLSTALHDRHDAARARSGMPLRLLLRSSSAITSARLRPSIYCIA